MAIEWTPKQKEIINCRGNNMLVSAAAGSGKTTVLVERILERIMDESDPVMIDNVLVVTFTKTAAADMSFKIRRELTKALEADPDNEYLQQQLALVYNAQFSTIDSFCNSLVKNHFYEIGINPDFKIMDKQEELLASDSTMDALFERHYDEDDSQFLDLLRLFSKKTDDNELREAILKIYNISQSHPWPAEYIKSLAQPYEATSLRELFDNPKSWYRMRVDTFVTSLNNMKQSIADTVTGLNDLLLKDYYNSYEDYINELILYLTRICDFTDLVLASADNYDGFVGIPFADLTDKNSAFFLGGNKTDIPQWLKDNDTSGVVSDIYKEYMAVRKYLFESVATLSVPEDVIISELHEQKPVIQKLISLSLEFYDDISELKKLNGWATFADVEHFALDILVDPNSKQITQTALNLQDFYEEVMVDEYQDTNDLQEAIFSALCADNRFFAVGDVKQSIYAFRQAKPRIFNNKMSDYRLNSDHGKLFILDNNFRSRKEVLEFVNDIFKVAMRADVGNIDYTEDVFLNYGASYPDYPQDENMFMPEVLLVNKKLAKDYLSNEEVDEELDETIAYEAKMVALKIKDIMSNSVISDGSNFVKPRYSDIAILLRANTTAAVFEKELLENDIPVRVANSSGYFDRMEVQTIISFLKVINNPNSSIDLASVLHSPIYNFSNDDLARLRILNKSKDMKESLFFNLKEYVATNPEDEKFAYALTDINTYRAMAKDTAINVLVEDIIYSTHFYNYVLAMPSGTDRARNLQKLVDIAVTFANNSTGGLFHFIKHVDRLKKYEVDVALSGTANTDTVTIYSMHKSKGLEFPVCFVCGLGKSLRNSDTSDDLIIHNEYGVAMKNIDAFNGKKSEPFIMKLFKSAIAEDSLGEELRVLYVALTRAQQKLILTGMHDTEANKNKTQYISKPSQVNYKTVLSLDNPAPIAHYKKIGVSSFIDLIEKALNPYYYPIYVRDHKDMLVSVRKSATDLEWLRNRLFDAQESIDDEVIRNMAAEFDFTYPYVLSEFKSKYSVSEVKHHALGLLEDDNAEQIFVEREEAQKIPKFIADTVEEETENVGALYGTAMHRYLECFDFVRDDYADSISEQLEAMCLKNLISERQRELLKLSKLEAFVKSDIARQMHEAAKRGGLFKEKPFVISKSPADLFPDDEAAINYHGEKVLVQGIIDVYFETENGIILLDYKTDSVDSPEELINRYSTQLNLYADAIESSTGKKVTDSVLYSFKFDEVISNDI